MSLTFRTRLLLIVGIVAFAFILVIITGATMGRRVEGQLATIYGRQLPRLELGPQLETRFEHIRRGFQDAVASRDVDNLEEASRLKARLLQKLDEARDAVDPADAQALRVALDAYCAAAYDVSRRLIAGETGESLPVSLADMQTKQIAVERAIARTAAFDRRELVSAFAAAARAERAATSYQLAISIACLVAVLTFTLALGVSALRTLSELRLGLERFGKGDFSQPIETSSQDELGQVGRHANRMAASLEALARERDRAEGALKVANRELEAFSYSVAHDLRAPLRGINGFSRAVLEDSGDKLDQEGRDQLERIAAAARRMGELIDAMLTLSRLSRVEVHGEAVDVGAMAEAVLTQLRTIEPERAVDFVSQGPIFAHGDARLLRAAMENLVGNAWKFTRDRRRARIEVGSEEKDGAVVYYIRDNGAGFDMAYSEKLFIPFQRLHNSAEFAGTGIGLATVQRVIDRHGGRIWAEGAVDVGAVFYFTLPHDSVVHS